ncbi:MAG: outer membrane lipoprotein chaperone LolA [Pseudomonadota bacterium]|nr:outer membrane lipoprotein chaperone LolA [Pseudomonadota bacterium]
MRIRCWAAKRWIGWVVCAALVLGAGSARAAAGATTPLDEFLKGFVSLKARFEQVLLDEQGVERERSQGTFYLSRPGRFRWDYESPYQQSIVADGQRVYVYDQDLEQVTVKPLQKALGSTPALLLDGEVNIEERFVVSRGAPAEGLVWLELGPRDARAARESGGYAQIRLGFAGPRLKRMDLRDNLNQTTRIEFKNAERNPSLDPSLFTFTPPEGVDVLDAEQDL